MQSMIPVKCNGKDTKAFFDIDWEGKRIENIRLREDGQFLTVDPDLSDRLADIIEQKVADILMEAALDKMQGKATIHA
jgi:hypothetical protein